jgi:hypothetical protein
MTTGNKTSSLCIDHDRPERQTSDVRFDINHKIAPWALEIHEVF